MSDQPQRRLTQSRSRALIRRGLLALLALGAIISGSLAVPDVRQYVRALVRPVPPPQITPLALSLPTLPTVLPTGTAPPSATATSQPRATPPASTAPPLDPPAEAAPSSLPTATLVPTSTPEPTRAPTATVAPPTATAGPIEVNGRRFDAYIPAATKPGQFYQYSCEFDAAWVILATYGINIDGDELIAAVDHDRSVEPYIEETAQGFVIHGGDIARAYSGDYTKNFLARSTATAMRSLFERYGLETTLVSDRAGVEAALRSGALIWMKTTVDFNTWRPATWVMPDGRTHSTVLGNDHAVVAMGFSERGVVIRDVLGPTSTNRQRPYEYEVDWATFMAAWGAQSFDGLAVTPPGAP
jgi:hypothetical protein